MDLLVYLSKTRKKNGRTGRRVGSWCFYQIVKVVLGVAVISPAARELLINGPLPVPVVSAIALRQGARVAGTRASTAAAAVDAGRHRRTPRTRRASSPESAGVRDRGLNLTADEQRPGATIPGPAGRNRGVLVRVDGRRRSATGRGCDPRGVPYLDDAESRPAGLTSKYLAGGGEKLGNTL